MIAAAALEQGVITPGTRSTAPATSRSAGASTNAGRRKGTGRSRCATRSSTPATSTSTPAGLKLGIDRLAFFARGSASAAAPTSRCPASSPAWCRRRPGRRRDSASRGGRGRRCRPRSARDSIWSRRSSSRSPTAAIGNGGRVVRPRLILQHRRSPTARWCRGRPRRSRSTVPVSEKNLAIVRRALTGVVEEPRGTGGPRARARDAVAGKTGTAQVVRLRAHRGARRGRDAAQVPRSRLVRGLRAGRRAADRGGGSQRARRARRQRRRPDRAARARALVREACSRPRSWPR